MKETEFYALDDAVQKMKNITNGYFPTVEELKTHQIEQKLEKYSPIIMYFASDPFTREGFETKDEEEYKKTVRYCRQLTSKIILEEE